MKKNKIKLIDAEELTKKDIEKRINNRAGLVTELKENKIKVSNVIDWIHKENTGYLKRDKQAEFCYAKMLKDIKTIWNKINNAHLAIQTQILPAIKATGFYKDVFNKHKTKIGGLKKLSNKMLLLAKAIKDFERLKDTPKMKEVTRSFTKFYHNEMRHTDKYRLRKFVLEIASNSIITKMKGTRSQIYKLTADIINAIADDDTDITPDYVRKICCNRIDLERILMRKNICLRRKVNNKIVIKLPNNFKLTKVKLDS